MRQYRLNRESILYIEGRRPANTPCGHRESCLDEFETLPIPILRQRRPLREKMKPQPRFKALAGIFYRGFYAGTSEVFSLSIRLRGSAVCVLPKTENSQTFGIQPIFGAFREPTPNPRFKSRDCAKHAAPGFSEKPLALRFKLPVRKPRYLARLRLFKLSSYLHRLYGHQRANCEKIPQWYGALMDLSRAWRALYPSAEIAGTVSPNGKRAPRGRHICAAD